MDGTLGLVKEREQAGGQRQQGGLFLGETLSHLLARGAVNAHIRHGALPVGQVLILLGQGAEGAVGQGVGLDIVYVVFTLAFMLGSLGFAR